MVKVLHLEPLNLTYICNDDMSFEGNSMMNLCARIHEMQMLKGTEIGARKHAAKS